MTLDPPDKQILSDVRMEKAREFLEDCRGTLDDGRYRTSVNRAYYAVLNAARAILILTGANPKTHDGVMTMLSLRLVKTGVLPVDVVKSFKLLLSRRVDVDYGDFDTIGRSEAEASLVAAEQAIDLIDTARTGLIDDLA